MNPYLIAGGLLAVMCAFGGGYWKGQGDGRAVVRAEWNAERLAVAEQHAKDEAAAREKERQMQADADRLRKEKDVEIRETAARAAALANQLRHRPERPASGSGVSASAGTCVAASGAQLARGDGEFLAGYAADAARLQIALDQCVAQYNAVRR